ncbi:MAG: PKD domain-containing protein [Chitinophagaceae bacterium]
MIKIDLSLKRFIYVLTILLPFTSLKAQTGNIQFIENKGQWDDQVKYKGVVPGGAFFVRKGGGFTILQHNPDDLAAFQAAIHGHTKGESSRVVNPTSILRSHAFHVDFVGAADASQVQIIADKPLDTYNNYFIGNDPSKWATKCKVYQGITVKNVYPNVDVRYYTDKGFLKYDIIANPGADISKIALRYDGVDTMEIKKKELSIGTSVSRLKELAPYTFQFNSKGRTDLDCKYILKNNVVRFNVKNYDKNSTVVIDPTVVFIDFSGSTTDNWGYTATYGPDGSMFGGGIVFGDGFPTTKGAFQENFGGGASDAASTRPFDIGIIKISPDGKNRIYGTYIGGNGNEQPHSLVVDGAGNLILAGRSNSSNYPVTGTGLIGPGGGYDIVVTKLDASGGVLLGSKRIGGTGDDGVNITVSRARTNSLQINYGDDGRSEVILDNAGNIYVASSTQSLNSDATKGFPIVGGFQKTPGGGLQDGVLLKFPPDVSTLSFSSFLGGNQNDAAYVLSINPTNNNIYVGGATESDSGFPGMTGGTISSTKHQAIDGFVSIVSNDGSTIIKSTYVGTDSTDAVYGLKFDRLGFPYIMGQTYSKAWPHVNATYYDAGAGQFISKLQPDLSGFVYSTTFGKGNVNAPSISPVAFLVDRCENVYVSGWGGFLDEYVSSGTTGMPVTPDAYQSASQDNHDFYFFVLKKNAASQLYGSFLGSNAPLPDHVDGGTSRFDQNGVIYQAICGNCDVNRDGSKPYFPTTGGWGARNGSQYCNLAMVKISFNLAGVGAGVQASIDGVPRDTSGCIPLTVDFRDTVATGKTFEWTFGDGSPTEITTTPTSSHTYTAIGNYLVMLVAVDSSTCNMRDTVYTRIRAGNKKAILGLNFTKLDPCDSFKYQFNNVSVAPADLPFTNRSFVWTFGDNTPPDTTGAGSVSHNYSAPGSYHVTLTLIDTNYCNAPQVIDTVLSVADIVIARFNTPPVGCAPYTAVFENTSQAGQTFVWDFGDGTGSTDFQPTHVYNQPGQYTIRLTANNDFTCNKTDDTTATITVYGKPTAQYSYTPIPPVENTPNVFTNLSSDDAVNFVWLFGDGDSVVTTSRAPLVHQYGATGTFNACLVAINIAGCPDTTCKPVETIVNPLVDVPNAFTPNSGDINSKVMVKGFGIAKMKFMIFNRWGQKVFETNDPKIGWDGRFKGALQPMDVYAYTLNVEFFDGTKTTRTGDITLIK